LKEETTLQGHSSSVTSVAFSPDGKYLASGSQDNTFKLWSMENFQKD
jgi:WD40 repeat protein